MSSIFLGNPPIHLYFAQTFLSCQFSVQTACLKVMSVWSPLETLFAPQSIILTSVWGWSAVREQKEEWASVSQLWRPWVLDKLAKKEMLESACQAKEELHWLTQETDNIIYGKSRILRERERKVFSGTKLSKGIQPIFLFSSISSSVPYPSLYCPHFQTDVPTSLANTCVRSTHATHSPTGLCYLDLVLGGMC